MRNTTILGIAALACAFVVETNAGPLDPPAGPVSSSYKTLNEVEARTPLGAEAGATLVINEPGSYYLTGNSVDVASVGVVIQSGGVTLDLNGFSLIGNSVDEQFLNDFGILVTSAAGNVSGAPIVIRNGSVEGFNEIGISSSTTNVKLIVEGVHVEEGSRGAVSVAGDAHLARCTVRAGFDIGATFASIDVGGDGVIESCTVEGSNGNGIALAAGVVRDCVVRNAALNGYVLGVQLDTRSVTVSGSLAEGCGVSGFLGNGPTVFDRCVAERNTENGFRTIGSTSHRFTGCTASFNGENGFSSLGPADFDGCVANFNGIHGFRSFLGSTVARCSASANTLNGFDIDGDSSVTDSSAQDNLGNGFDIGNNALLANLYAADNQANGILGAFSSIVRDCTAVNNSEIGIFAAGGSRVFRNTATDNGTDFTIGGSGAAPIVSDLSTLTNPLSNITD